MIRPLTIATCLLACGSGLYLYQSKHEVQLLDRTIERAVHETSALREQSRLLAAEWTMLNDPGRLRQFSDTYLNLKTITPSQFTSLADLDVRLPSPQAEAPANGPDAQPLAPVAADTGSRKVPDPALDAAANQDLPVPPIPAAPPTAAVASVAHPADTRTADRAPVPRSTATENQVRPTVLADTRPSDQRPSDQRPAEPRATDQHVAPRPAAADARPLDQHPAEQRIAQRATDARVDLRADARLDSRTPAAPPPRPIVLGAPRPTPAYSPNNAVPAHSRPGTDAAPVPFSGSLLGMARGSMPAAPRPTPVSAQYNAN